MAVSSSEKKDKLFYGWWIVLVCSILSTYAGGIFYYGFSTFVKPIVTELGWSLALISGAFTLTRQAMQLGYFPRQDIIHTSRETIGQVYLPVMPDPLDGRLFSRQRQAYRSANLAQSNDTYFKRHGFPL